MSKATVRMIASVATLALGAGAGSETIAGALLHRPPPPQDVTATFSGYVEPDDAVDTFGEFGPIGGSLANLPYTLTFKIDDVNGTISNAGYSNSAYTITGNLFEGSISATLTINNVPFSITTGENLGGKSTATAFEQVTFGSEYENNYTVSLDAALPFSHAANVSAQIYQVIQVPILFPGTPDYHAYPLSGAVWTYPMQTLPLDYEFIGSLSLSLLSLKEFIGLSPDELTVTSVAAPTERTTPDADSPFDTGPVPSGAVPEPATWAMIIVGLGPLGAVLRRRHGRAGLVRRPGANRWAFFRVGFWYWRARSRTSSMPGSASLFATAL